MSGHGGGDPLKVIKTAFYANLAIAAVKFVAAYLSRSTATLAEAVHSVADTGNQALLFVGLRLAMQRDDERFAFGRSTERYFWPFIVALLLFSVGGMFALIEGIQKVAHPDPPDLSNFWSFRRGPLTSLVVLGVSAVFESISCSVALREFRAQTEGKKFSDALFGVKDPTIPLVLMEDISALIGLTIAFAAVGLSALTDTGVWDGVGSILIGLLLMVVAALIARDAHSLLIGERADPEVEHRAQALTEGTPGVRGVTQLLTMHLGPDFVLLAMKVAFEPKSTVEEVEEVTDTIERRVRAELPAMKKIFIEPDSKGDRRGVIPREEAQASIAARERPET
jgi:cation diffusion facilitator family transporter